MLKLVTTPNIILTGKAKPVAIIDKKIAGLVTEMIETLEAQTDPPGVGLAAPQIGVDLAIFIIKPSFKAITEVFINPKIMKIEMFKAKPSFAKATDGRKNKDKVKLEGCLSIPRIWGPVKRADKVLLEYQNISGEKQIRWFTGFKATIIQHEMDHLQGILFTQRSIEQNKNLYEEKGEELVKITDF